MNLRGQLVKGIVLSNNYFTHIQCLDGLKDDILKNKKPITNFKLEEATLKSLEPIADLIKSQKAKNIIILTGAGISTSAGIPDFRSPKTGLYHNLQKYNLPMAEDIFCIEYFEENPHPFFELVRELYPGTFYPTLCHYFIRLLGEKGLLVRNFTQNIDGLERLAGLGDDDIVESHGSFHTSSCIDCRKQVDTNTVKNLIFERKIPKCEKCNGLVKPDIVFFGESMPTKFFTSIKKDFPKCDLLIIMGTFLKVQPFASLVDEVDSKVPKLLINLENSFDSPSPFFSLRGKSSNESKEKKYFCKSNCDDAVYALCDLLGWKDELMELYTKHTDSIEIINHDNNSIDLSEKSISDDELAKELDNLKIEE